MKALKPRVKISGFVAVLLAGVVLAGIDEAAARSMSNHNVGLGNGRPPAHNNTNHQIVSNPGSGTSKPGKHSGKSDKTYGSDHDRGKDHKNRKAAREERRERKAEREREEGNAERKGSCITKGGCRVDVGKPTPPVEVRDHRAPTVEVRDHGTNPIGASVNSTTRTLTTVKGLIANGPRDHRGKPSILTPSDLRKLNTITNSGGLGLGLF